MSFEESVLLDLMRAVNALNLDTVLVGGFAAAVQGVPVTTQVIELFIQDTPENERNLEQLASALGPQLRASRAFEPRSRTIRIEGLPVDVDFVFELSSLAKSESVKSRSSVVDIEGVSVRVSHLRDIIDAKRAAGRPKDLATVPMLEEFLRVQAAVQ